ncbi:hypothetical protein [Citrobacter sp.]|uniref:hypothetical protein n=1 Tax=Citrobacter sp. TaxID=1896336 RepID=UPI002FC5DBE5
MSNVYVNNHPIGDRLIFVSDFKLVQKSPEQIEAESKYPSYFDKDIQHACHVIGLGSLTVLDRRTGFGWRDTETGFRDWNRTKVIQWKEGEPVRHEARFWLASGMFDIREFIPEEGILFSEAVAIVKSNANNCRGD